MEQLAEKLKEKLSEQTDEEIEQKLDAIDDETLPDDVEVFVWNEMSNDEKSSFLFSLSHRRM